jgi:ribonucleoside-triphosphate reductase
MIDKLYKQLNQIDNEIAKISGFIKDPSLCENTASIWTRISGYFRPVENFNDGKQQEFLERLEYKL